MCPTEEDMMTIESEAGRGQPPGGAGAARARGTAFPGPPAPGRA